MYKNIFDTHAHYDDEAFQDDLEGLLSAFPDSGISGVVSCGVNEESSRENVQIAEKSNFMYAAVSY